jgi:hypothetical protein
MVGYDDVLSDILYQFNEYRFEKFYEVDYVTRRTIWCAATIFDWRLG